MLHQIRFQGDFTHGRQGRGMVSSNSGTPISYEYIGQQGNPKIVRMQCIVGFLVVGINEHKKQSSTRQHGEKNNVFGPSRIGRDHAPRGSCNIGGRGGVVGGGGGRGRGRRIAVASVAQYRLFFALVFILVRKFNVINFFVKIIFRRSLFLVCARRFLGGCSGVGNGGVTCCFNRFPFHSFQPRRGCWVIQCKQHSKQCRPMIQRRTKMPFVQCPRFRPRIWFRAQHQPPHGIKHGGEFPYHKHKNGPHKQFGTNFPFV